MSVAIGHTSKANGTGVTSLNLTHDCTGDNLLLAQIVTRGNVTSATATYNSVSMTLIAGPLTCTAGAYAQQWVFKLPNPSTGSNTLAFSWTTSADVGGMAVSYTGAGGVGTPVQATGNLSYSPTITANDMVVGFIASPNPEATITTYTGQTLDVVSSYSNQTGGSMNHATGTGAVTVDYTIGSSTESVGTGLVLLAASVAFDSYAISAESSTNSKTWSHTCSGSNRYLVVAGYGRAITPTGCTYNGVSMTKVGSDLAQGTYSDTSFMYVLSAPDTGAHDIVVSFSGTNYNRGVSSSYTGVIQTGQPDASADYTVQTVDQWTHSITTTVDNCWLVLTANSQNGRTAPESGLVRRSTPNLPFMMDSDSSVGVAGSKSVVTNNGTISETSVAKMISLAPAAYVPPAVTATAGFLFNMI